MYNPFEIITEKLSKVEAILLELKKQSNNIPIIQAVKDIDTLLNAQQASELLNIRISTLYSLVSRREIPNSKRGNRLYFFKNDLITWVKTGKRRSRSEIESISQKIICKKGAKSENL